MKNKRRLVLWPHLILGLRPKPNLETSNVHLSDHVNKTSPRYGMDSP